VDVVILQGRETPTTIYEILVEDPGLAATEWLEEFDAGVTAYLAGEFAVAQTRLARARDLNPDDTIAGLLAQRCRRLGLHSSGEWTGAWKLTEK